MKGVLIGAAALVAAWAVEARADNSSMIAFDLGDVIGSEKACGLSFDQEAIARFVETKVPSSDLRFTDRMGKSARIMESRIDKFGSSQKTAHCVQVRRIAETYGFVK